MRKSPKDFFQGSLFLTAVFLCASNLYAQSIPDAGKLRQQLEQNNTNQLPAPKILDKKISPTLQKLTGQTLVIKAFTVVGNTKLSNEALQAAVAPYLHRTVDFSQLQDAASAVGNAYREAGWIVRAFLPQQEIENGIVKIEVIEAVFGSTRFEGQESAKMSNATIQKYVDAAQRQGTHLSARALDRTLLILGDLPGIAVMGNLREGQSAGQTDLIIQVQDKPFLSGNATIDNTGSRSTGGQRLAGNISVSGLLGRGDQLNNNVMLSEGSGYERLAFSLPLGQDGWRAGVSTSYMSYRVIAPEMKALDAHGASSTFGADATYPIIRSRLRNLFLSMNLDHEFFNNQANGGTVSRYYNDAFSLNLNGNVVDSWLGGGVSNAGLGWVHGRVDLSDSPNRVAEATSKADGQSNRLRYSLSRVQAVTDRVNVYAQVSGQVADKNLNSGAKFYLGGANGVRAYPSGEVGGSDGQLANFELRVRLPQNLDLTGFYDWGHVKVVHDTNFVGAPKVNKNSFILKGSGVMAGWLSNSGLSLRLIWARRIGDNPNPTATGNDQDGSLIKNRLWLQASMQF